MHRSRSTSNCFFGLMDICFDLFGDDVVESVSQYLTIEKGINIVYKTHCDVNITWLLRDR